MTQDVDVAGPRVTVGAVVQLGDAVLLVRRGDGAADGVWDLPGGRVRTGEALAEAVARSASAETATDIVCGPFLGWTETPERPTHDVRLFFEAVEMGNPASADRPPLLTEGVAEVAMMAVWDVNEARLAPGVAEFLAEIGVIDLVV